MEGSHIRGRESNRKPSLGTIYWILSIRVMAEGMKRNGEVYKVEWGGTV